MDNLVGDVQSSTIYVSVQDLDIFQFKRVHLLTKDKAKCYSSISADGSTVFIENQIQKMSLISANYKFLRKMAYVGLSYILKPGVQPPTRSILDL